jgi:hypothetical protein
MFNLIMCSRSASLFGTVSRHSKRCCNHNDGKSGLTSNGVSDHSSRFLAGEQTNRRYVDAVEIGKDQVPSPRPLLGSNQKLTRPNARRRNQSSPKCRCCDNPGNKPGKYWGSWGREKQQLLRNVARCDCLPETSVSGNCHGIMPWRQCRLDSVRFEFQNVEPGWAFRHLRYYLLISTRMI